MGIQKSMTQDEIQTHINTYLLAIEPLVGIAIRIELTQPIGYQIKEDGSFKRIEQYNWSPEAKGAYEAVQKEIEYIRDLYLGGLIEQERL